MAALNADHGFFIWDKAHKAVGLIGIGEGRNYMVIMVLSR